MPEKNQKYISLGVITVTALLCAAFFLLRVWHLQRNGTAINYLAELWAPSSVLSIVVVTFVEKLTAGPPQAKKAKKKRR
jgi:hypothetical protein